MDEKQDCEHGDQCMFCKDARHGCSGWGLCSGSHHSALHLLIKIGIVWIIFWAGMQFGELRSDAHQGYMMGAQSWDGGSMMGNYQRGY